MKNFHGKGLNPKQNAQGWWIYDSDEVETFKKSYALIRRKKKRPVNLTHHEMAALCVEHFIAGSDLSTIVIEVGVAPEQVKLWYKEWKAGLEREREKTAEEKAKLEVESLKAEAERAKIEERRERSLVKTMNLSRKIAGQ